MLELRRSTWARAVSTVRDGEQVIAELKPIGLGALWIRVGGALYVVRKPRLFSGDRILERQGREIAIARPLGWSKTGYRIDVDDRRFTLRATGWFRRTWVLESEDGRPILSIVTEGLSGRVQRIAREDPEVSDLQLAFSCWLKLHAEGMEGASG